MVRRSSKPEIAVDTDRRVIAALGPGVRKLQEELASARCPLCRAVLVARQGRAGPYFFCRCARKQLKRAS